MTALFFDRDGVLADTERFGHLPAFNQTFAEGRLPGPAPGSRGSSMRGGRFVRHELAPLR